MSTHVPSSSSVCIHSVCIAPSHRGKGVGSHLLREYIDRLERRRVNGTASYERVILIAHDYLRSFYERAGFEWIGKSDVVYGSRPWYEMCRMLGPSPSSELPTQTRATIPSAQLPEEAPQLPSQLWETLQSPSRSRPVPRLLSSFSGGLSDITTTDPTIATQGPPSNKFDLLCPRSKCGSIILKAGVANWVERSSVQVILRILVCTSHW
jgi:guanine nucleotide exchange factor